MTVDIVGPLEIIAVQHNHAHGQALVYQAISARFKVVAVAKPRQFVLVCQLLGMFDHRYVVRRHDDRLQPALLIAMLGDNL